MYVKDQYNVCEGSIHTFIESNFDISRSFEPRLNSEISRDLR